MNNIRYICLSDLHLGAANSILTRLKPAVDENGISKVDPTQANDMMIGLADCLKVLVSQNTGSQKPTLVLNGDILEFALADVNVALMVFKRFMELTMKPGEELFDQTIYYNPGNHDHHVWETARETQYTEKYLVGQPWDAPLDPPWHTTHMFLKENDEVPCYLLNQLMARMPGAKDNATQFVAVYPNFGVLSADGQKCVVFSHGHYIEPIYRLMTDVRSMLFPERNEPEQIWELEAENFAWVDFFWSTLGRSGDVGSDVELIYDKLQTDTQLRKLVSNLAEGFTKQHGLPWVPQTVEHMILTELLNVILTRVANREVKQPATTLSADAGDGLRKFLEFFLLRQIAKEKPGWVPSEISFIFGHTHKPFEKVNAYAGYPKGVNVYNDGGWVVDGMDPVPLQGGAIVLVDDALNVASVRLYNEATDDSLQPAAPYVSDDIDNSLVKDLKALLLKSPDPWKNMTQAAFAEIPRQRANLIAKIQKPF